MGLDLVGFSSRVLPTSAGYAADRRHARGGAAASHGFFAWRSHPRTTLKDSVVCSTEDGGGGGAESTLCVSGPSENASRATGGVAADLGRGIADGITASQTSSMGRKKGGRLWRRPSGGDKPARAPRRAPVREDPQVRRVLVNNPDVNAILSGVSRDSSIAECNSVLIRLEKHSDVKALDFFVWMKANGKLERNADAYRLALQAIAWKEDWRRAELLLHEMVAVSGCRLDAGAFNGLIYVCAKRRLADWGTKWFHMMLERKVQPNVSTVGMLMGLYQKTGNLKEAEFAFVKTRECNVKCVNAYSAMITLYTRSRLFDKSEEVITLMKHDGVVPNMENWLVQLNAYSQQGKMEEAELVLQSMEDGGVSPNVVAYNTVITGYGKVSDMQKAKEVFDRLGSSGLAPDETTYRSMIEGFGRADKHKEAISYYKKLKSSGFQPNASNFYTMINLIARHDDSESAAEILRDMRAAGCQCSSIVTILVRAYRTVGRMHKVLPILQSCFYKKVLYDATSCSILVTTLVQNSLLEEALCVLREKKWQDSDAYQHQTAAHSATATAPLAFRVTDAMALATSHRHLVRPAAAASRVPLRSISVATPRSHPRICCQSINSANMLGASSTTADDAVPQPVVLIDQDSDRDATIVQLSFGDRLGALLDTMKALKDLGLDVTKGSVATDSSVTQTKFHIMRLGRKVEDPDMLETIRLTIINNLLQYHPESSEKLAMGEFFGIKAPEKKVDVEVATHVIVQDDGPKRSMLYIETADRPGLLLEVIKIITDVNIDVESAEIDTEGLVAKDKFHVSYRGAKLNSSLSQVLVNCLRYYLRRPETDEDSY